MDVKINFDTEENLKNKLYEVTKGSYKTNVDK